MREAFHIISDGSCDLPTELVQEKNITVVPFYVSFDDTHSYKEKVDIAVRDFYQMMVDKKGVYPKSSMPSIEDYEEAFLPLRNLTRPSYVSASPRNSAVPCSPLSTRKN